MNQELQIFAFDSNAIRVLGTPEEPLFVAKDVCEALDIKNARDTIAKMLDDDEKGVENIYTPGGHQDMNVVTESGLYNLIFRSNKPEAKAFKRWVTHEVLPSIRKTGMYATNQKIEQLEHENDQWQKNLLYYKKDVIELHRARLFNEDPKLFYEAQWIWRLRLHFESFREIAEAIGWTTSKVSSRFKKYKEYVYCTSHARIRNTFYAPDDAKLYQLFEWTQDYFANYQHFLAALLANDQRLHHLGSRAKQTSNRLNA